MDLVSLIKGQLSGNAVDQLAGMLSIRKDEARQGVDAAVPALLAGMADLSSTSDGTRRLSNAVDAVDDTPPSPAQALGGETIASQRGEDLVSSLFGSDVGASLTSALSRFTGLGAGAIGSILGFVGPTVLGVLKGQKRAHGLDAGGLANLLAGQKQNILNAMPPGLVGVFGSVPGLDALGDWTRSAGDRAIEAARGAEDTVRNGYDTARDTARAGYDTAYDARPAATASASAKKPSFGWVIPVAALLALAAIGWWLMSKQSAPRPIATAPDAEPSDVMAYPEDAARRAADAAQQQGQPAGGASEALNAASTRTRQAFDDATASLANIRDPASADAALPRLQAFSNQLGSLESAAAAAPTGARQGIATMAREWRGKIDPLLDRAMAVPGVGDKLRPVATEIRRRFDTLTDQS